jgi:hypothetical protein
MLKKSKMDLAKQSHSKQSHIIEVRTQEANQYQIMLNNLEKLDLLHREELLLEGEDRKQMIEENAFFKTFREAREKRKKKIRLEKVKDQLLKKISRKLNPDALLDEGESAEELDSDEQDILRRA